MRAAHGLLLLCFWRAAWRCAFGGQEASRSCRAAQAADRGELSKLDRDVPARLASRPFTYTSHTI